MISSSFWISCHSIKTIFRSRKATRSSLKKYSNHF